MKGDVFMATNFNPNKDLSRVLVIGDINVGSDTTACISYFDEHISRIGYYSRKEHNKLYKDAKKEADGDLIVGRFLVDVKEDKTIKKVVYESIPGSGRMSTRFAIGWFVVSRNWLMEMGAQGKSDKVEEVLTAIYSGNLGKLELTHTDPDCKLRLLGDNDECYSGEYLVDDNTCRYILVSMRKWGRKIFHWSKGFVNRCREFLKFGKNNPEIVLGIHI